MLVPKGLCPLCIATSGNVLSTLGINRVPAVVINGQLADCCSTGEIDVEVLRSMGLGQA